MISRVKVRVRIGLLGLGLVGLVGLVLGLELLLGLWFVLGEMSGRGNARGNVSYVKS